MPIPLPVRELLAALDVDPATLAAWPEGGAGAQQGDVSGHVDEVLFGFFHLDLTPGGPRIPFRLKPLGPAGAPDGFQIDLLVGRVSPVSEVLGLVNPDAFLRPAGYHSIPAAGPGDWPKEWLEPVAGSVALAADLAVRIRGTASEPATVTGLELLTGTDPKDGIITVRTDPGYVLFGDTGFGLDLTNGLLLDDSTSKAPDQAVVDGAPVATPSSDTPAWRGVALRQAHLFIPRGVPLIGGTAVPVHLELGRPGGLDAVTGVKVPASGRRPALDVRLEWHDPAAAGLADSLPTLIEVTALLQVQGAQIGGVPGGGSVTLGGGAPLTVRARFTRDLRATPTAMAFNLAVEGAGDDGLVRVDGSSVPGKVFVTAAALATALVADSQTGRPPPSGDSSGVWLHNLLVAATGASAFLAQQGKVVIHGVSLQGQSSVADTTLRVSVDYSVDVVVTPFEAGVLQVFMDSKQPMRVRYRNVSVEVDPDRPGLDGVNVSFDKASMEVEDPGRWEVISPGSVLDIVGTRSGHGSLWYEVDLKFKLDLGPIKVSDATIRVTADGDDGLKAELRGLGVSVQTGAFSAEGAATVENDGFSAVLAAQLGQGLGVSARAWLVYKGDATIAVGVEGSLPGPIPLGPTMLGLYTLGGIFGLNARPVLPEHGDDVVQRQLTWTAIPAGIDADPGSLMFGLSVGLGTLYDWGFSFSAHGKLILTVPDPSLRIAAKAWLLSPRDPNPDRDSLFTGVLVIDGDGVAVGLRGELELDRLLKLQIPISGYLPFTDPSKWSLDLGSDGHPLRPPGPIQATLLPDLFDIGGFAYLMLRGNGIERLGNEDLPIRIDLGGPAIGFGMGFRLDYGVRPVCWMSLSAGARAGLSTDPWFLAAVGTIDGSLHLGPFSIGAHADLAIRVGPDPDDFWAKFRVCGSIDLWLTEIKGCVGIEIPPHAPKTLEVPAPDESPLQTIVLSDRHYVKAGEASSDPAQAPVVWPDVVPILQFSLGPSADAVTTPFTFTDGGNAGDGHMGNDQLSYVYTLEALHLYADDGSGGLTKVPGTLEAAWQRPKHALELGGPPDWPGAGTGARELALLTFRSDLWAARRSDGGAGHPADPVRAVAEGCHEATVASPGWALGTLAIPVGDGWRMRPDPVRRGRPPSVFSADVHVRSDIEVPPTEATVAALLQPPAGFVPDRVMLWSLMAEAPTDLSRSFAGVLRLPAVAVPLLPGGEVDHEALGRLIELTATITPSEPVSDPALWVTLPRWAADRVDSVEILGEDPQDRWTLSDGGIKLPDSLVAFAFRPDDGRPISQIQVRWPAFLGLGLLGLRGTTDTATRAADARAAAVVNAAATITDKNEKPPGDRTPIVLEPDTLYKIVVRIQATGRLGETSQPETFPETWPRELARWFRTAPKALTPGGGAGGKANNGAKVAPAASQPDTLDPVSQNLWVELVQQATFDTSYLRRYLKGYRPADRTVNWYYGDDELAANFDVDHIAQLAALYGYGIDLTTRRTDAPPHPPDAETDRSQILQADVVNLIDPSVLPVYQQRYEELAATATCPLPSAGASLKGSAELEPQATYELAVAFLPLSAGTPPAKHLPGIVFTTSRYRGPTAQLAALGFGTGASQSMVSGHLPVTPDGPAGLPDGLTVSDAALAAALERLGLTAWPLPEAGRTSALWAPSGGGWGLAGALLESPEPVHRPGRIEVRDLYLDGQAFGVAVRDTSGSRLLFLTRTPFAPGQAGRLRLTVKDSGALVAGHCTVGAVPAFARELV